MVWTFASRRSYQVVPACVMNHPAFFHHRGAPPLGVFNGLDHPHQWDVAACGGAARTHTRTGKEGRESQPVSEHNTAGRFDTMTASNWSSFLNTPSWTTCVQSFGNYAAGAQ